MSRVTCLMCARFPCVHVSQVSSLHEVYLLLDTDEAAAAVQLRESLDTLHQGEASHNINISQCSIMM